MTSPELSEIVTASSPGLFTAFALDRYGHAWRSFVQFWPDTDTELRLGQTISAIVRTHDEAPGGYFLQTPTGQDIFLSPPKRTALHIGQHVHIQCVSEARHEKVARGILADGHGRSDPAWGLWLSSLPETATKLPIREDAEMVAAARDRQLQTSLTVDGGGRIRIEHTQALTVIDIDSAGRRGKGSAGARALTLNRAAVVLAAQQIAVRDIGGLVVIDLVGPLNVASGKALQALFVDTFQSVSDRRMTCLAPSRLGLMEISIAWGACPAAQRYSYKDGSLKPDYRLLQLFEDAVAQLAVDRSRLYTLRLGARQYETYVASKARIDALIQNQFFGRLEIARNTDSDKDEMVRR